MIFLSAQPAEYYFKWQIEVLLTNISKFGISKDSIHILFGFNDEIDEKVIDLVQRWSHRASFYFYRDTRNRREYLSSIRPHIIAKHFDAFPELQFKNIFYHDVDIIFKELPNFEKILEKKPEKSWFVSDADFYIGIKHLNYFNNAIIDDLCEIVNVDVKEVFNYYNKFGGAQYIVRNLPQAFWLKHEKDSEEVFKLLNLKMQEYKKTRFHGSELQPGSNVDFSRLQVWCADMWSMFLNGIFFRYRIYIEKELDFCWPNDPIESWREKKILHNAGVTETDAYELFYKGFFKDYSPYNINFDFVNKNKCTIKYVEAIKEAKKAKRFRQTDVVFFFLVQFDSEEQYVNLKLMIKYLSDHFDSDMMIWEIDESCKIHFDNSPDLENIDYRLIECKENKFARNYYFDQFLRSVDYDVVLFLDTDFFSPPSSIIECIGAVCSGYTLALPFNKFCINITDSKFISRFAEKHDIEILKKSTNSTSILHSFEGGVIVNRRRYLSLVEGNEKAVSCNEDNLDRVVRVLANNHLVFRSDGDVYRLSHSIGIANQD